MNTLTSNSLYSENIRSSCEIRLHFNAYIELTIQWSSCEIRLHFIRPLYVTYLWKKVTCSQVCNSFSSILDCFIIITHQLFLQHIQHHRLTINLTFRRQSRKTHHLLLKAIYRRSRLLWFGHEGRINWVSAWRTIEMVEVWERDRGRNTWDECTKNK